MFLKPDLCLGVGINYRNEIAANIVQHIEDVDFVEINTERFFLEKQNSLLDHILTSVPIVLHGLTLSVGTANQSISQRYIDDLSRTLNRVDCAWFSEHIAITNVDGLEIRALMPVEFNDESIERIVRKNKQIMALTKKPFLLENIAYYYSMPNTQLNEAYFIKEIIERSDCGLLLDINNLYVNSMNHHYNPYDFLNQLPLERVIEVHLAGCDYMHNMLVDTHASSVRKEVLALFQYVCQKTSINGVVIERDAKLNNFSELLNEVYLVREMVKKYHTIRK